LEAWSQGIRLLDVWGYFDQLEPRLGYFNWMRFIPGANRWFRIVHYQLGQATA
jgi:hypothetical protein